MGVKHRPTRVVLHIDELVLRGIHPAEAKAFVAALQSGLAEHCAPPGALDALVGNAATIHAAAARVQSGASPATIGRAVARSIVGRKRR